jgi:hypothetical protein
MKSRNLSSFFLKTLFVGLEGGGRRKEGGRRSNGKLEVLD